MKEEKGLTYIGMVFLIILIAILVFGAIYFFRIEQWKADLENVKTRKFDTFEIEKSM